MRNRHHLLHDSQLGIVGDGKEFPLLPLPPLRALGDARWLSCAEVARERVWIARRRSCSYTSLPSETVFEEERAVEESIERQKPHNGDLRNQL